MKLLLMALLIGTSAAAQMKAISIPIANGLADSALTYSPGPGPGKHPLIIYYSGKSKAKGPLAGEYAEGIPYQIRQGLRPGFIVVAVHAHSYGVSAFETQRVIDYAVKHLGADSARVYLAGYSAGAWSVLQALTERPAWTRRIKAAVVISAGPIEPENYGRLLLIVQAGVRVALVAGRAEPFYLEQAQTYKNILGSSASLTITDGAHTSFRHYFGLDFLVEGKNIYSFFSSVP